MVRYGRFMSVYEKEDDAVTLILRWEHFSYIHVCLYSPVLGPSRSRTGTVHSHWAEPCDRSAAAGPKTEPATVRPIQELPLPAL